MEYSEDKKRAIENADEFYSDMLESERRYIEESQRLEAENARIAEQNRRREYEKRLASAKNAVNAEIVKENEILRRKKLADEEYLEQLKQTAEAERLALEEAKDNIREIYADIADYAEGSIGDVVRAQEKMEEKLAEVGTLAKKQIFRGADIDGGDLEYIIAADVEPQIKLLTEYRDALEGIKARISDEGFSGNTASGFFAAIAELDVEKGMEFARYLNSLNDEGFTRYLGQWEEKQRLSEEISKQLYNEEFKAAVDDSTEYMKRALSDAGLEIPEGFTLSGSLSAEKFGTAFIEEMQEQMEKVYVLMETFSASLSPLGATQSGAGLKNVSYNNAVTYILKSSGETVAEQLASARSHSELERMRNQ